MKLVLNLAGIVFIIFVMWFLSYNKKSVPWKLILKALAIQFIIALILVKIPFGRVIIAKVSNGVSSITSCGHDGLAFVFGSLADRTQPTGSIFIIQVLGNIIFMSALVSLLHYLGVLGFVVKWIGRGVGKVMGTSEAESFVAVANMFLGNTDSPILVSKYLPTMTDSEIMVVLVSGMGSMAVSILGGYAALGIPMEYLLLSSALVPIGSILIGKLILPEAEELQKIGDVTIDRKGKHTNLIEAVTDGAMTGMRMVLSIAASLVAMVALVTVINKFLGIFGLSMQQILSYVFAPIGFFMGLDSSEILTAGSLLGNKMVLNEFVAFRQLGELIGTMDRRTAMMCTISLCGFANFGTIGIAVSGTAVLCPERKSTLAKLVFRSMLGGIAVSILSAMIVGVVALF